MSNIHYFQRYTQKENVVTNNTLLLFSRLYSFNPARFEDFLKSLVGDDNCSVGLQFNQQMKGSNSTPDGFITQQSHKILIETKLYDNPDFGQLKKHLNEFDNEEFQLLLLVDKSQAPKKLVQDVNRVIKENNLKVVFEAKSFSEVIESMKNVLSDYDIEMNDIVMDFENFCDQEGLIPRDHVRMRAVTTGYSFDENMKYNIYYQPESRGYQKHRYIGLYKKKSIRAIGELKKTAVYDPETGEYAAEHDFRLSDDELECLKQINNIALSRNWNQSRTRFFLVEKFYATKYEKRTKYPIQNARYFYLDDILELRDGELPEVSEIAEELKSQVWE